MTSSNPSIFRRLFFISVVILLIPACSSNKPVFYERSLTGLDFSKYSRDGFLVTTGDFYRDYKSLSILRVTCYDGYLKKESPDNKSADIWKEDDLYGEVPSEFNKRDYEFKSCKLSEMLDFMVDQAIKIGGNGIIKLEITPLKEELPVKGQYQNGILISGQAISFQAQ